MSPSGEIGPASANSRGHSTKKPDQKKGKKKWGSVFARSREAGERETKTDEGKYWGRESPDERKREPKSKEEGDGGVQ